MSAKHWTFSETLSLVKQVGIVPLEQTAQNLNSTRSLVVARLRQLGIMGKNVHGMPFNSFKKLFGQWAQYSLTSGAKGSFRRVPWVWIDDEIEAGRLQTHQMYRDYVSAMAIFQRWVLKANVLAQLEQIAKSNEPKRRTHCFHGHELTEANLYITRGWVKCTQCRRLADNKRRARRKGQQ